MAPGCQWRPGEIPSEPTQRLGWRIAVRQEPGARLFPKGEFLKEHPGRIPEKKHLNTQAPIHLRLPRRPDHIPPAPNLHLMRHVVPEQQLHLPWPRKIHRRLQPALASHQAI